MQNPKEQPAPLATAISDVRNVPLGNLALATADQLRRIVPAAGAARVPVAAFNASL